MRQAISELFSQPRVTLEMRNMMRSRVPITLWPGSTFDLAVYEHGVSYDFRLEVDRARAWKRLEKELPYLIVASPPARSFPCCSGSAEGGGHQHSTRVERG